MRLSLLRLTRSQLEKEALKSIEREVEERKGEGFISVLMIGAFCAMGYLIKKHEDEPVVKK